MKLPKRDKRTNLEKEIDAVLGLMSNVDPRKNDYAIMVEHLKTLHEAQATVKSKKMSPDAKAIIGGNLLILVITLGYERAHVITTKALGFVIKGRV